MKRGRNIDDVNEMRRLGPWSCEAAQVALGALQDPPVHGGSKRSKFYRVVREFLAECGAKLKERGFSPVPW